LGTSDSVKEFETKIRHKSTDEGRIDYEDEDDDEDEIMKHERVHGLKA